ncbi:hypothetical protein [Mucilaginibacter sp.]|jgi:hypothetical protein|uniref:hypothetical protein n=1 Tax=Mucilaginibacter sp. TaxID=1882438 RepID=UPI0035664E7C
MLAILTPSVMKFLVLQGYRYCLSKTTSVQKNDASVCITLKPIKSRPATRFLPQGYDTYFSIMHEPLQMAQGINDTEVLVKLDDYDLKKYKGSISIV